MKHEDFHADPFQFASLIAHQLQSPLNAIHASLQTVLAEYAGPLSPRQRGSLEKAHNRCNQAITSVRRMLAIMKASAGDLGEVVPVSLAKVLGQVQSLYAEEARRDHIDLILEPGGADRFVGMGEAALAEVLSALVSNAIKYTPGHGVIRMTVQEGEDPGRRVSVLVADSGVGIPDGDYARVFEPFYRTPAARDSARPGAGLGLAFVYSVVTAMGGTVFARKSLLGGAEFVLDLPVVESVEPGDRGGEPAFRVVIIGGVSAGPKAAAKIIRLMPNADVTVLDKGSVLSYAGCGLPYYVAGVVRDQRGLISSPAGDVRDPVFFRSVKNIHVRNQTEAVGIDRDNKQVRVRDLRNGGESWLPYDKLLIATGSSPILPPHLDTRPSNVFTLHGVRDAEGIKTVLAGGRARDVVIVGGGLIGIEMTEALVNRGSRVTIIEKMPHILSIVDPDISLLVERHLEQRGVRIVTGEHVEGFEGAEEVTGVRTRSGVYAADMVILATGVKPNTKLAEDAGLEIGSTQAIAVDSSLRTSDPDIFAAGDCAQTIHRLTGRPCWFPLGSTANKQGRVAAVNICGGNDTFPGVAGSIICKVFDYCVARTGLAEQEARDLGCDVMTVLVPGPDRAHFMPDAKPLLLKLIVDRNSRRLLGAQATGPGAADKRIDVATMAIVSDMTVDAVANLDMCYAPPYSSAMDNLITAANVARNKLDGYMDGISAVDVHDLVNRREPFVLLDVRTPAEYEHTRLPGSRLIPLAALRERMGELPRDQLIVTFCDISLRGYEAALILKAAGFGNVRVLEGGIAMWPYATVE